MSWFASTVGWIWSRSLTPRITRRPLLGLFLAMSLLMLSGQFRVLTEGQFDESFRVSGVIRNDLSFAEPAIRTVVQAIRTQKPLSLKDRDAYQVALGNRRQELLQRSQLAAEMGAKLIYRSEGALALLHEDEQELIAAGLELSGRNRVYLGMAIAMIRDTSDPAFVENKIIVAFPDRKSHRCISRT
ncbi:MAG: hypothetical protein JNL58_12140 [Planctomyces sp.]|nr:hypothetical protein [Planctomyces sp.]